MSTLASYGVCVTRIEVDDVGGLPCACLYAFTRCIRLVLPLPAMPITIATVGLSSIDALAAPADALAAAAASPARSTPRARNRGGGSRFGPRVRGDAMAEATGPTARRRPPRPDDPAPGEVGHAPRAVT